MNQRQQSGTTYPVTFFMVLASDHLTPATGKTVTVTLSKNGGAFGAAAGAVSEIGNGWYSLAGNATDRNTLGDLLLRATATACDETPGKYVIVPYDPFARVDANVTYFGGTPGTFLAGRPEVKLGDVAHGGASATLALLSATVHNPAGDAVAITSDTGNAAILTGTLYLTDNGNGDDPVMVRCVTAGADAVSIFNLNGAAANQTFALNLAASGTAVNVASGAGAVAVKLGGDGTAPAVSLTGATVNANLGTTQPVNFTGVGAAALAKSDVQDWKGATAPALSALLDAVLIESGIAASAALVNDAGTQLTSINARQALAAILSSAAAVLSGGATTAVAVKPAGKPAAADRIDATVDADGNRSAVSLRVPT